MECLTCSLRNRLIDERILACDNGGGDLVVEKLVGVCSLAEERDDVGVGLSRPRSRGDREDAF